MEISFTKMQGCGNDFIFLDCLKKDIPNLGAIAGKLCDRRFGIGADQLLTIHPSKVADFKMEIYNADGSQVEMCGNGIRCFAKYVYDHGITQKRELEVETLGGIIRPRLVGELVEVDMGEPILEGRKIPVDADGQIINRPLTVDDATYQVTCVSMGNPHCVLYLDDIDSLDLKKIGPRFEHHPFFPKRVNTEFVKIVSPKEVRMRVWERGAGETWACGTGASAVGVAGAVSDRTEEPATLSHGEHEDVVEAVIKGVKKRGPVIAGAGSNSTEEAVRLTRAAERSGADGALMLSPYYSRPTQEGICQHDKKVADSV